MPQPWVSKLTTVIPVYNGERYLREALASVAQQSRRPDRLVVLDNCSTDRTEEIVREFGQMPCEWVRNERNLGLFGNMNRALSYSPSTEYLHILHADDRVHPHCYRAFLSAMEPIPGRALAYSQPEFIDADGRPRPWPHKRQPPTPVPVRLQAFLVSRAELGPIYFPGVLLKTAGQPSRCEFRMDLPQLGDQVFWAEWAFPDALILEMPPGLAQYRVHSESQTQALFQNLQAMVADEWRAMHLIAPLVQKGRVSMWCWQQKLRCLFAARTEVKVQQLRLTAPDLAAKARALVRQRVPWLHRALGRFAVWVRGHSSPRRARSA